MHHRRFHGLRLAFGLLLAGVAALALSACGASSSGDASSLLQQTFSGKHKVDSGNLNFTLSVNPSGSTTVTKPISFTFGGPFQSLGTGKLPESNFTVSVGAQGKNASLGIVSTGTNGYVTLSGTGYQLPASSFQQLESSFAKVATPSGGSGQSTLSALGIHPLKWVSDASVVGDESVGGTDTTHIKAKIDVAKLLADLNTFLSKASTSGVSGANSLPTSISPATQQKIAGEVSSPSFDVWTGKDDKTIRKMTVALTLPVTGQISTLLGGMKSAQIAMTLSYANLNQPQTIHAPSNLRPYSEFTDKLKSFLGALTGGLSTGSLGSTGSTGTTGTGTTGTTGSSASGATNAYAQCIQQAGSDVSKMQQCASLLSSGG